MEVSNAKPITTAMHAVILKFISWVTTADERAIGVDTGLHAGILSCTLIHICRKPKHITDYLYSRISQESTFTSNKNYHGQETRFTAAKSLILEPLRV
jgi:hypothetical protein